MNTTGKIIPSVEVTESGSITQLLSKGCQRNHVKVINLQGKLQNCSVHVNRMKQLFAYDDTQIEFPTNLESIKYPLEDYSEEFKFIMDPCDKGPYFYDIQLENGQNSGNG